VALAQPPPGQTEFPDEPRIHDYQHDERAEKHEEAIENVLVDNIVDEIALEVRLNGGRWLHTRHVRRHAHQR